MNQRGFALVESLATMTFAVAALAGGAGLSYAAFARMYLKHASYEAAVCLMTTATSSHCKQVMRSEVEQALPIGRLEHLVASPSATYVQVTGTFVIPGGVKIPIDESRQIPNSSEPSPDELKRRFP